MPPHPYYMAVWRVDGGRMSSEVDDVWKMKRR